MMATAWVLRSKALEVGMLVQSTGLVEFSSDLV